MLGLFLLPVTIPVFLSSCYQNVLDRPVMAVDNMNGGIIYDDHYDVENEDDHISMCNEYEYEAVYDFSVAQTTYCSFDDSFYPLNVNYNGDTPQWTIDSSNPRNAIAANNFRIIRSPTDSTKIQFRFGSCVYDEGDYHFTNYKCTLTTDLYFYENGTNNVLAHSYLALSYDQYFNAWTSRDSQHDFIVSYKGLYDFFAEMGVNIPLLTLQSVPLVTVSFTVYFIYEIDYMSINQFLAINNANTNAGYETGYSDGYNTGYIDGESIASETSYQQGYTAGSLTGYNNGYELGQVNGYNNGYQAGLQESGGDYSFRGLFRAIVDTPIWFLNSLFNFDFFGTGTTFITMITSLLTALVIVTLIKKVF